MHLRDRLWWPFFVDLADPLIEQLLFIVKSVADVIICLCDLLQVVDYCVVFADFHTD